MRRFFNVKRERFYILPLFFLFFSFYASAQYQHIIGLKIQGMYAFNRFDKNQYVSNAFEIRPLFISLLHFSQFYRLGFSPNNTGFTLREKISSKIDVEIGWMYWRNTGGEIVITGNYLSKKNRNRFISSKRYFFGQRFPLSLYYFFQKDRKIRKFVIIGGEFITNRHNGTFVSISRTLYPDADPIKKDTLVITTVTPLKSYTKFTFKIGIGAEKVLWDRLHTNLSLVYNQGFSPIYTSDTEYEIGGTLFNNRILNKGTYLAIELNIGINPFPSKKKRE